MARNDFGGTPGDTVWRTNSYDGVKFSAAAVTVWSARVGGTRYTDLLLNTVAVDTIPVDATGQIPVFQGPDGVSVVWISADGGDRAVLRAAGAGTGGGSGGLTVVDNGDGTFTLTGSSGSTAVVDNGDGTLSL